MQISFGTAFWSTTPEKIWAFVDAVMEKNIPFVSKKVVLKYLQPIQLSRSSAMPRHLQLYLTASRKRLRLMEKLYCPNGVLSKPFFLTQYAKSFLHVLCNTKLLTQATGWFITHCGQNSIIESLTLGVPMYVPPHDLLLQ